MNDLSKCPKCGGYADNGHDRCLLMNLDDFPFDEIIKKSNSGEEFIDNINELAGGDSDAVINIYFKLCGMIGLNNKLSLEAMRDFEAMHGISILPNLIEEADKILEKLK